MKKFLKTIILFSLFLLIGCVNKEQDQEINELPEKKSKNN